MKRNTDKPHWIRHTHLFERDSYECSVCGKRFAKPSQTCPACHARMNGTHDPQEWVDEAAMLDIMLER